MAGLERIPAWIYVVGKIEAESGKMILPLLQHLCGFSAAMKGSYGRSEAHCLDGAKNVDWGIRYLMFHFHDHKTLFVEEMMIILFLCPVPSPIFPITKQGDNFLTQRFSY